MKLSNSKRSYKIDIKIITDNIFLNNTEGLKGISIPGNGKAILVIDSFNFMDY